MENTLTVPFCPSCGHERPERFCPACGERRLEPDELSIRHFFSAAVKESPFESRLGRTLVELFRRPGLLTAAYLAGRRTLYVRPFRVYLLISVLFFLIVPHTGLFRYTLDEYDQLPFIGEAPGRMIERELERTGEARAAYAERFNETLARQRKAMMVFLVPMFALGMVPLFRTRRYGEHLVFSTHYFAALLLYLGVIVQLFFYLLYSGLRGLARVAPELAQTVANIVSTESALIALVVFPGAAYLAVAARRAYGVSTRRAVITGALLALWQIILIMFFYRTPLFFTTFYSLRLTT